MNRLIRLVGVLTLVVGSMCFAQASRVSYDSRCMTIDGQDRIIFSGAFHYFRCPKELWRDRLAKMKQAGLNCVETYVAWNWHEREMPSDVNDFSKVDLTELKEFLKIVHDEFGFYSIIRPGPYICAEWYAGGYPRWLADKKPASVRGMWLRSDDPEYLKWSRHWYQACVPIIAEQQLTRRAKGTGGTILFQIENEYDFNGGQSTDVRVRHLKSLYKDARDFGIDVPLMTCWTRECRGSKDEILKNVFDGPNCYPRNGIGGEISALRNVFNAQPNAPVMIPEMQGGWFAKIGDKLAEDQGFDGRQIQQVTLAALAYEATITSYYMFFGGTNFGDWAADGITTTYDYDAPIREHGGVGERYFRVASIGKMIQKFEPQLVRSKFLDAKLENSNNTVDVRPRLASDGTLFVFLRNTSLSAPARGTVKLSSQEIGEVTVPYDLPAFEMKVCVVPADDRKSLSWYPEPVVEIARPKVPYTAIRIASALARGDNAGNEWKQIDTTHNLLRDGIYDARYVFYRASFELDEKQLKDLGTLIVTMHAPDHVLARVNGKVVAPAYESGVRSNFKIQSLLTKGENQICLAYESNSVPNGGIGMERLPGINSVELTNTAAAGDPIVHWRVRELPDFRGPGGAATGPSSRPTSRPTSRPAGQRGRGFDRMAGTDVDDSTWASFDLNDRLIAQFSAGTPDSPQAAQVEAAKILFGRRARAVFRSKIDMTQEQISAGHTRLRFDRIDDTGTVFVNGNSVGQSTDWRQPFVVDAAKELHPGSNIIAVVVENNDGEGGLTLGATLFGGADTSKKLNLELATIPVSYRENWSAGSELTKSTSQGWTEIALDTKAPVPSKFDSGDRKSLPRNTPDSLLTWYRIEFELPEQVKEIWVPWRAKIDASGNGAIFLNGRQLGRYWEIGPQREYYLPETWLKFGKGNKNVLTLAMRATQNGAALRSVEVSANEKFAEQR